MRSAISFPGSVPADWLKFQIFYGMILTPSPRAIHRHFSADQSIQTHFTHPNGFLPPVLLCDGKFIRISTFHHYCGMGAARDDAIRKTRTAEFHDIPSLNHLLGRIHHPTPDSHVSPGASCSRGLEGSIRECPTFAIADSLAGFGDTIRRDARCGIPRLRTILENCGCLFGLGGAGNTDK